MRTTVLIGALLAAGCGSYAPTQATTETPNQQYALEQAHYYAKVKGIRLDAVRFSDQYPNYLAWAECNEHVIAFNRSRLEEAWIREFIPAIAAHEVCHIFYKDNLPCGQYPKVDVEARAEACGKEML
jgi:hypothetical protein